MREAHEHRYIGIFQHLFLLSHMIGYIV